jgi:hypothetical protein
MNEREEPMGSTDDPSTLTRESAPDGVEWEMVVRWPWDDEAQIEVRAIDLEELEVKVTAKNACGGATGARRLKFADVRRALDEVERLGK